MGSFSPSKLGGGGSTYMWVWKFAISRRRGSQPSELYRQRSAGQRVWISSCLCNQPSWESYQSDAEGVAKWRHGTMHQLLIVVWANVIIPSWVNNSVFQTCLVNYPGHLSPSVTCHVGTAALQTACWLRDRVGIDLYTGHEFWTFFQPQSQGGRLIWESPYTREYKVSGHVFTGQSVHIIISIYSRRLRGIWSCQANDDALPHSRQELCTSPGRWRCND